MKDDKKQMSLRPVPNPKANTRSTPQGIPKELLKPFPEGNPEYVKKLMDEFRKKFSSGPK